MPERATLSKALTKLLLDLPSNHLTSNIYLHFQTSGKALGSSTLFSASLDSLWGNTQTNMTALQYAAVWWRGTWCSCQIPTRWPVEAWPAVCLRRRPQLPRTGCWWEVWAPAWPLHYIYSLFWGPCSWHRHANSLPNSVVWTGSLEQTPVSINITIAECKLFFWVKYLEMML